MAGMTTRLGRLERIHGDIRKSRTSHRELMQMLCGLLIHHNPNLELVRPEDTDEQTYAEIDVIRLRAMARHHEADRLDEYLRQIKPQPPPELIGNGLAVAAWMSGGRGGFRQQRNRAKTLAIAAARVRVNREQGPKPARERRAR